MKRVKLYDREVATNEDAQLGLDLRSLDLNASLEAAFLGSFGGGPTASSSVRAGAILSGLMVTGSTTGLSVNVSSGLAVFGFGTTDSAQNRYRLGSLDASSSLSLPVSDPAFYRWDLIEVSAEEVVTTEVRQVLSVGPRRGLVNTPLEKFVTTGLRVRVRPGKPESLADARLPALQPDAAWLPIAAVRVTPGALTLSGALIFDLRKLLHYCSPTRRVLASGGIRFEGGLGGFDSPVSVSSSERYVNVAPVWARLGNYCSPLGPTPGSLITEAPRLDVNSDKPVGLSLAEDTWYYVYAYRPHVSCGFSALVLSSVPPLVTNSYDRGIPSSSLELPTPWALSDVTLAAQYVGAVRLYNNSGTYYPLPFVKVGGFTSLTYESAGLFVGANTQGKIHAGARNLVGPGSPITRNITPDGDGLPSVPPHAKRVRLSFHLENLITSSNPLDFLITSSSTPPFVVYRAYGISPGYSVSPEVDCPTESSFALSIAVAGSVPDQAGVRGWVRGFYEDLP